MSARIPRGGIAKNPFGPQWVESKPSAESVGQQVQDSLFGRPRPRVLDETEPLVARLLAELRVYAKRLARIAQDAEDEYELLLAEGTIASIDAEGVIYVGRDFLLAHADERETRVGVLAHEIGHRPKRWVEYRSEAPRKREEVEELCRFEETRADYFAGFALAQLQMDCEPLCSFFERMRVHAHREYFSPALRAETVREAHAAGRRKNANFRKFFPAYARMMLASGDLGGG